jgi:hypothetical protein
MRRSDLMHDRHIITIEELEFGAKLTAWLDQHEAKWLAKHARRGRPPTKDEWNHFAIWQAMTEEHEWERFYGPVEDPALRTPEGE